MRRALAVLGASAALLAAGCGGGGEEEQPAGGGGTQQAGTGKEIFVRTCAGCHTLSDAGTNGQVGPNLDELEPDAEQVKGAIESGPGSMPDDLLQGANADAVAEYVASAAGG